MNYATMNAPIDADSCLAFLVRHGATDSNLANPPILQGRSIDGPLSAAGREQAAAAAACLAELGVSAVYSSPLRRARETAEAIALPHQLPIHLVEEISEVDVGAWERRSWVEIAKTEPDAYRRFQEDPARHGYRDGENLQQVHERVEPAIHALMDRHMGERIVIVAHNVVNRVFLANTLAIPLARARSVTQANCGINVLRRHNGATQAVTINAIFHLPPALVSS